MEVNETCDARWTVIPTLSTTTQCTVYSVQAARGRTYVPLFHGTSTKGRFYGRPGGRGPPMKNVAPSGPPFWPSLPRLSLKYTSNILNLAAYLAPRSPAGIVPPHCPPSG